MHAPKTRNEWIQSLKVRAEVCRLKLQVVFSVTFPLHSVHCWVCQLQVGRGWSWQKTCILLVDIFFHKANLHWQVGADRKCDFSVLVDIFYPIQSWYSPWGRPLGKVFGCCIMDADQICLKWYALLTEICAEVVVKCYVLLNGNNWSLIEMICFIDEIYLKWQVFC